MTTRYLSFCVRAKILTFPNKIVDAEAATPAMDATCDTCAGSKASVERLEALVQELDDLKKAFSAATGQAGNVFDVVFAPANAE